MKRLIEEISARLNGLSVKKLEEGQPTWKDAEKMFVLKICIAGAFGSANFFLPRENTQERERDCFNSVNDLDIFRTVYYKNMDRNLVGEVYVKIIEDAFITKGIIDRNSKMSCRFNSLSEKIFITFEFEADGPDSSRLKLSHQGIPNEGQAECLNGWNQMFNKLEDYLIEHLQ